MAACHQVLENKSFHDNVYYMLHTDMTLELDDSGNQWYGKSIVQIISDSRIQSFWKSTMIQTSMHQ